jgi:hypothetical protein
MTISPTYRQHRELSERLLEYRGAITRRQADELFGSHALDACIADNTVFRILPNVYVHTSLQGQRDVRVRAASRWAEPNGALTGAAALWAWGALKNPPERVTVQLPPNLHLERPLWVRVIRPATPPECRSHGRYTLVGKADAAVQAWSESSPRDRIGLLVDAMHRGNLTANDVAAAAARRYRIKGRAALHRTLGHLDGGVTSFLEYIARTQVFPVNEFPELKWGHHVIALGRDRYIDAADPVLKLALEFDGDGTHSLEKDRLKDLERDAALVSVGFTPLHFTYDDIMYNQEWCRQVYRAARAALIAR